MTPAERAKAWRAIPGNIDRERETKRRYKAAHPVEWHQQKQASTLRYNRKNIIVLREKRNAKREELRRGVIEAYGCRCNCPGCHVHHEELLTVDHVNGGARHRKNRRSTRDVYRWLQKNNYPPEFQLLCGSCNLAKADRASCPLAGQEH